MKTLERESDMLKKELALFVEKMQLAGINITTIKKPTDAGTSISHEDLKHHISLISL